jgi:hypothetical protein
MSENCITAIYITYIYVKDFQIIKLRISEDIRCEAVYQLILL